MRNILERVRGYCTDELTGKRVLLPLSVEGQVDHLIRVSFHHHFKMNHRFSLFLLASDK